MTDDLFSAAAAPEAPSEGSLFHVGEDIPPALPERAAWGTAPKLRQWQQEALELYLQKQPQDFMAVARPPACSCPPSRS